MNGDAHDSYGTLRRLLLTPEQVAGVSGADWVGVLAAAEHHRVTGLLAARLELLGPSARPPDPIAARLRGIAMAVAVRNSRLLHELSLVLREHRCRRTRRHRPERSAPHRGGVRQPGHALFG